MEPLEEDVSNNKFYMLIILNYMLLFYYANHLSKINHFDIKVLKNISKIKDTDMELNMKGHKNYLIKTKLLLLSMLKIIVEINSSNMI